MTHDPTKSPTVRYFPAHLRVVPPGEDGARSVEPDDKGRIPVALSSEFEVERIDWWSGERYVEVLDHSAKSIDLMRADLHGGLPLIANHDTRDFRGKVEEIEVGDDRVLRGWMRFSKSQAGQEARQDVLDGLLTTVSIGYRVTDDYESTEDKATKQVTRRYRQWQPLELSLVPVPADPTVGVGRDLSGRTPAERASPPIIAPQGQGASMSSQDTAPGGAEPQVRVVPDTATAERVKRLGEIAREHKVEDKLPGWIANDTSVEAALSETAREIATRMKKPVTTGPIVDIPEAEAKRYSFAKAFLAAANDRELAKTVDLGFEREMEQEIRRTNPHLANRGGFLMPSMLTRAGLDSGTSTKGAELKFTQPGEFIDLLRNKTFVLQAGARMFSGLTGPVSFPKQSAAATAYWLAENSGSDVTASNLTLTTVSLAMKSLLASTTYSKQLLIAAASGNVQLEQMVRDDFAAVFARAIDAAAINGGSGNTAAGVLQNTAIGSVTIGANAGALTYGKVVDLETSVAANNGEGSGMAYLTTPQIRGAAKKLYNVNSTYGTVPLWQSVPDSGGLPEGVLNGYRAFASNQVPSNLTKGTATTICSPLIFGDWSQVMIGEWGAFDLTVDPYTLAPQAMIKVTAAQFVDVAIRQPAAFAAIQDILNP